MIGAVPAVVAEVAFWTLLVIGWIREELGLRGICVAVVLWLLGRFGLSYVRNGTSLIQSWTAILDIVLVLVVFKSDVRLA